MKAFQNSYLRDFTLESFIEGASNLDAILKAREFLSKCSEGSCALYINGSSGVGKTHLAGAVGNEYLKINPAATICTMSGDQVDGNTFYIEPCNMLILDSPEILLRRNNGERFSAVINFCREQNIHMVIASWMSAPQILFYTLRSRYFMADIYESDKELRHAIGRLMMTTKPMVTEHDVNEVAASVVSPRAVISELYRRQLIREIQTQ